jgi:acetyl esterase/lipase
MSHAQSRLIPRTKLFGNPQRAMCQLAPNGATLSWLAPLDGVLNIWTAPADDIGAAAPATDDRGRGIRFYAWARSGSHLIYIQDEAGNEDWHVYATQPQGGEARDLTPIKGVHAQISGASWDQPNVLMVGLNDRDPRWHDIYRIDIESGERELVVQNDMEFGGFTLDRALRPRIAQKTLLQEGGREFFRFDGDAWEPIFRIGHEDELATGFIGFERSGDHAHILDSRGRDKAALGRMALATCEVEIVAEDDKADISDVLAHPTSYEIEGYGTNYLKLEWTPLNDAMGQDLAHLQGAIEGEVRITSRSKADDRWIISAAAADAPETTYLYERGARELTRLFSSRPDLEDETLSPMHPVVIPSRDGLELVSYLTLPADTDYDGRPEKPLPMVLLVHGGPWARDGYGYNPQHQWLANRGYGVLSVNFRGSTGFGKAFVNAADLEWGARMHDDLLDAVSWACEAGIAKPEMVAIMGGSYGGYATLAGLAFTPEVFACGVDIVGPSNLETLLATIPSYWASFYETLARRVGDPRNDDGLALLKARSPLYAADKIARPLLIGQGANDPRVKQDESDQIVTAMKANDLPVTYVLYPDEGHGFARPENRMSFYAIAEAFLSRHLGGGAEPFGDDFKGSSLEVPEGADQMDGLPSALAREADSQAPAQEKAGA